MVQSQRREQLIDTAIDLFLERGYHATGIDTILATSGISKKTLYRHFRSKEELILAALKKYDGLFRNGFMRQVEQSADTPRDRVLAVFDVAADWFEENNFYGCMYINAIGEYSAADTAIRQVCKEFKTLMRRFIEDLCREMRAPDPATLAEEREDGGGGVDRSGDGESEQDRPTIGHVTRQDALSKAIILSIAFAWARSRQSDSSRANTSTCGGFTISKCRPGIGLISNPPLTRSSQPSCALGWFHAYSSALKSVAAPS
jgi:AcrR family transcriptional regulator